MVQTKSRRLLSLPDSTGERQQADRNRGPQHKRYFQEPWKNVYTQLLNSHLAEIDQQAQGRTEFLVDQMKQVQGITEQLKSYGFAPYTAVFV